MTDYDIKDKDKKPLIMEEWETKLSNLIENDKSNVESVRTTDFNDISDLKTVWEDEYYIRKGGGLQWSTSFAYRSSETKKYRPNSEDNHVFNATEQMKSNLTASVPDVSIEGVEKGDNTASEKLTFMSRYNDERNNFYQTWKKMCHDFVCYGQSIGMVCWDNDWIGGYGENRWVGDVRMLRVRKEEFFPDPAILDLDDDLQDGRFHIRKLRKSLTYVKKRFTERGMYVGKEMNEDPKVNEGNDPEPCYLVEYWHKGKPKHVSKEDKELLLEKAREFTADGDYYRSKDYEDMAKGTLDGIHRAYYCDGILLDYQPYVYEHGLYPFVFRVNYYDEYSPWGFGEIRNIKIPQVMHNKADEIEIEAYSRQGLGGSYYEESAVSPKQIDEIKKNSGKGGMWFAVKSIFKIKEREPVQTPASLPAYKEHKQRQIETISQNTPIQQGMAPSANMPYKAIAELGARTDIRQKQKQDTLEDFLKEMNKLRILLFAQYYTDDRYYRIKGQDGNLKEGTLNRKDMLKSWLRQEDIDEATGQAVGREEYFVPEFDIKIRIIDEKPKDRNYYTQTAMNLLQAQAITIEDVWYTLEEGKLPNKEEALKRLAVQNQVLGLMQQVQALPPEGQEAFNIMVQQALQKITQATQLQAAMDMQQEEAKKGGVNVA